MKFCDFDRLRFQTASVGLRYRQPSRAPHTTTMHDSDWEQDWDEDTPDPDDPRYYDPNEDSREALTAAERNPSLR
jgi:hypothetical protein